MTFNCLNCDRGVTRYRKYGNGYNKYCSNACATRHTKTRRFYAVEDFEIVFESSYECKFWADCMIAKIPVERFDRRHGINYDPARPDAWYAPDFWVPTYQTAVEIKGVEDGLDPIRWGQWSGKLIVFDVEEMTTLSPESLRQQLDERYLALMETR